MAQYPNFSVLTGLSAQNLAATVPNIIVKAAANTMTSTTTLTADPELSTVTLGVGTWYVEFFIACRGIAAAGIKTDWTFGGTTTGSPTRFLLGPGVGNAGGVASVTPVVMMTGPINVAQNFTTVTTSSDYLIWEFCPNFIVTSPGLLSYRAAQNAASATSTVINPPSHLRIRQVG